MPASSAAPTRVEAALRLRDHAAMAAQPAAPVRPQPGDVLVSRSSGKLAHEVSIVPNVPDAGWSNHDAAVEKARERARELAVDAWLTEDGIHFMRLASFRPQR